MLCFPVSLLSKSQSLYSTSYAPGSSSLFGLISYILSICHLACLAGLRTRRTHPCALAPLPLRSSIYTGHPSLPSFFLLRALGGSARLPPSLVRSLKLLPPQCLLTLFLPSHHSTQHNPPLSEEERFVFFQALLYSQHGALGKYAEGTMEPVFSVFSYLYKPSG